MQIGKGHEMVGQNFYNCFGHVILIGLDESIVFTLVKVFLSVFLV